MKHNAREILKRMERRQQAVVRELTVEARVIGLTLNGDAKRLMASDIYSVPIPLKPSVERRTSADAAIRKRTTKGKKGLWRRTGNLLRSEVWEQRGANVTLRNNAAYGLARNNLGTSKSSRQIRSQGVKSIQWQAQAVLRRRSWILERRRAAVLRALKG